MAVSLDPEDDDEPTFFALPSEETQELWYPSLRVTLWILSCLYTFIDVSCVTQVTPPSANVQPAVFDDLAQEAVMTCRRSLSAASDLLSARKDRGIDAKLFLVRHLLILKEMTATLDLGRKDRKKDWQGITGECLISFLSGIRADDRFLEEPS